VCVAIFRHRLILNLLAQAAAGQGDGTFAATHRQRIGECLTCALVIALAGKALPERLPSFAAGTLRDGAMRIFFGFDPALFAAADAAQRQQQVRAG